MSDLSISNKPKYGTGQFKTDSLSASKTTNANRFPAFDKYANNIVPIHGDDTKGVFKRFANSISLDSAYPTKLTESQRRGVTHKIRDIIGGNNTVKNEADIEAYNTKALFNHKTLTHGDVSTATEVATTALGVLAGGLGIIKGVRRLPKGSVINIDKAPKRYPQYNDSLDAKWFNKETGELNWPKNSGFIQEPFRETLKKGKIIDRYSSKVGSKDRGKFLSPEGTTYTERALPYEKSKMKYTQYEVVKTFEVNSGKSMQWFSEKGGGVQYQTDLSVRDLIKNNFLREVK